MRWAGGIYTSEATAERKALADPIRQTRQIWDEI